MKKIIAFLLVVSLTATIAIGGTLAYLTDRDSEANVFTVGDVKIDLKEDFEQGSTLIPGVDIKKEATIANTGINDAWVWLTVLLPYEMGPHTAPGNMSASNNVVHWNYPKESASNITVDFNATPVEIDTDGDGVKEMYYQTNLLWNEILKVGDTTGVMLSKVYMDTRVDIDPDGNMHWVVDGVAKDLNWNVNEKGNPVIYVSAYAMQTDGFETVLDAYNAYNEQWTTEGGVNNGLEWGVPYTYVANADELTAALNAGENVKLTADITGNGTSVETLADTTVVMDLNGYTFKNPVAGAPALINNGTLTIKGEGNVVNGTNSTKASHTIVNNGTLTIESGNIGTDDTAGAAVVNYGTTTINGGTFASKQENIKGDGLCAYAFINQSGTMTINDATLNGQTHGLFGAYGGAIVVNGGTYTMDGNGGLGCYVVYATGEAKVTLNGGTINTNSPRSNRVFFVYDNGNYFNAAAVETGKVVVSGATIYLDGVEQTY